MIARSKDLIALVLALALAGCPMGLGGGDQMLLTVEATGARPVTKTAIGLVPLPSGDGLLLALLFDIYAGPFIERTTELDHCRLASAFEPADPVNGVVTLVGMAVCRLGPNKVRVNEVVTVTLTPQGGEAPPAPPTTVPPPAPTTERRGG